MAYISKHDTPAGAGAWLEITDVGGPRDEATVQLAWRCRVRERTAQGESSFASPQTAHMRGLLQSYVREFRSWREGDRDRGSAAERLLLNLGRALGDALVGKSREFSTCAGLIEAEGVAALRIALLSDDPRLCDLPWELLILPGSAFVAAAAGAAFVRAPPSARPFEADTERLELSVERPLRYLHLAGAFSAYRPGPPPPTGISTCWTQLAWQGGLHYRLAGLEDFATAAAETWHIVRWSGPVPRGSAREQQDERRSAGAQLTAGDFIAQLRHAGTRLLILEPSLGGGDAADAVARLALAAGIHNVVVAAEAPQCGWPSDWAEQLLQALRAGLGVQRAMIETRKRLQRAVLEARRREPGQSEPPHPAQLGHVLRHYSQADALFFEKSLPLAELDQLEASALLRHTLFGFSADRLPPIAPDLGDAATLALVSALRRSPALIVSAPPGGGVTHALHRAALLLRGNAEVARAYYWDFAVEAFTAGDLLQMVAGARGETDPERVSEQSVLLGSSQQRELFVLDNLDVLLEQHGSVFDEIVGLTGRLAAEGGYCLLGMHAPAAVADEPRCALPRIELPSLAEAERVALAHAFAPATLALGSPLLALLEELQDNPLLMRKVLVRCTHENLDGLLAEARRSYGRSAEHGARASVASFFALRWHELESHWQRLLCLCLPLEGLYLQLPMIAANRPDGELTETGRALWDALSAPADASFAAAIARLEATGFVESSATGTRIDRAALRFLRAQPPLDVERRARAKQQVARLCCEGLLRLLGGLSRTPHAGMSGHLLASRGAICRQIERAMRAGEYVLATQSFLGLHAQMVRANLTHEAAARACALLEAAGTEPCSCEDVTAGLAWLSLASRALADARPPFSDALAHGLRYWQAALKGGLLTQDPSRRPLLLLAVQVLERAHDLTADYAGYREVARVACEHLRAAGEYVGLIPQLKCLAAAEYELGNASESERAELELIDALPYAQLPNGAELRSQTLASLAAMRLRRGNAAGCEALVERIEAELHAACEQEADAQAANAPAGTPRPQEARALGLSLRGELALFRAQWERACQYFCELWSAATKGQGSPELLSAAGRRLSQLEARLGAERFSELYARYAGSAPAPDTLGFGARAEGSAHDFG